MQLKKDMKIIFLFYFSFLLLGIVLGFLFMNTTSIQIKEINSQEVFKVILGKNLLSCLILILSIFFGKLFLKIFFASNGLILGLTIAKFQSFTYFLLIVPHGVIEIPAFFYLGYVLLKAVNKDKFNFQTLRGIVFSFFLLFFAALLESFVTPEIVKYAFL